MTEKKKKNRSGAWLIGIVAVTVALLIVSSAFLFFKVLINDDGGKRKRKIQMVQLVKPPPPPKVKEKPPEPEIKKKEEIIEPEKAPEEPDEMEDEALDDGPMDDDLGLDADGSGGSDSFGLRAKKGGRSLIGGGMGKGSLLRKFAWYTGALQDAIRKKVNEYLEENGGIPGGDHKTLIHITLDERGVIVDFEIYGSSGNAKMDHAVGEALKLTRIDEPPPPGMPRSMRLKITSKG